MFEYYDALGKIGSASYDGILCYMDKVKHDLEFQFDEMDEVDFYFDGDSLSSVSNTSSTRTIIPSTLCKGLGNHTWYSSYYGEKGENKW